MGLPGNRTCSDWPGRRITCLVAIMSNIGYDFAACAVLKIVGLVNPNNLRSVST